MKTFGYKRTIDLNKFDFNSIEKEILSRKEKVDNELKASIKKRDLSDNQIIKSVSEEMITAMDNWQR